MTVDLAARGPQPFFLDAAPGQRFCLFHAAAPDVTVRGTVLYVHPFAEELNKSRRMAAVQARAFSAAGFHVLQPDLYGCGDSDGDFGDARWHIWRADLATACDWLRAACPAPLYLWGLRLGALLALDAAAGLRPAGMLLWQPVVSGRAHLNQFLRLQQAARLFAAMPTGSQPPAPGHCPHGAPPAEAGDACEIAGYALAPEMAAAIGDAGAAQWPPGCPVCWLELAPQPASAQTCAPASCAGAVPLSSSLQATLQPTLQPSLQPASALTVARWRAAGARVQAQVLAGPPFWHSAEITEAPALLAPSLELGSSPCSNVT